MCAYIDKRKFYLYVRIYSLCCVITIISTYIKLRSRIHDMLSILYTFPQANPPTDLESVVSTRRDGSKHNLSTQRQLIDKNVEILIQINPGRSNPHDDRNFSELDAIRSERLRDTFEIVSEQQSTISLTDPLGVSTTVRGTPLRLENRLTETNRRTDHRFEDKVVTSKVSRIARDREHILGQGTSQRIHKEEATTAIPDRSGSEIAGSTSTKDKDEEDLAGNATTIPETIRGKENRDQFVLRTNKSNVRYSRLNEDTATTAVALVAIGAIMLLVGPIVIVLRILDERRQARKLVALSASVREDLPPTYEQAVLMDEAPRYSTLTLNYDRTPPSSPTVSTSTYAFPNVIVP